MDQSPEAVNHPVFARLYDRFSKQAEQRGQSAHRDELLAGLRGRVLELGAGNGLNFARYPRSVDEVLAVEPEPHLRRRAEEAARRAPVAVRVLDGLGSRVPAEDGSCDAAVASLVLCTVPDQSAALGELYRVTRPGGELRFYEHVVSRRAGTARCQRVADRLFWTRLAGGCHLARDTDREIERAGFVIESCRRFPFSPAPLQPPVAHILGVAHRP